MHKEHGTYHVRFYIIATILGIAVHLALHELTQKTHTAQHGDHVTPLDWAVFIAFTVTAINFFHGKILTGADEEFRDRLLSSPLLFFLEFVLTSAVVVSLAFVGANILHPHELALGTLLVRLFDIFLVSIALSLRPTEATRKAQMWWLVIDLLGILIFLCLYLIPKHQWEIDIDLPRWIKFAFCGYILVDVVIDYVLNKRLYFPQRDSWREMADFWDAAEGEDGDIYRRKVLLPTLIERIKSLYPKRDDLKILDLGCGNGCVARELRKVFSATSILGIDRQAQMIAIAERYSRRIAFREELASPRLTRLTYACHDIVKTDTIKKSINSKFDVIIACFALQDAEELDGPFATIEAMLERNGVALVVYENDNAFADVKEHPDSGNVFQVVYRAIRNILRALLPRKSGSQSDEQARTVRSTRRQWIEPRHRKRPIGDGRKAQLIWDRQFILGAQSDRPAIMQRLKESEYFDQSFVTTTRHWTDEDYTVRAKNAGLVRDEHFPTIIHIEQGNFDINSELLLDYQERPRFSLLVFRRSDQG